LEGDPFSPPANVSVVWNTTATNLPTALWVYRIYPQSFSLSVISNLLTIGKLQIHDRVKRLDSHLSSLDTNFMRFTVANDKGQTLHCLDVAPSLGWINYHDTSGNRTDPLEEAPAMEKSIQLANQCVFMAGIDRSLINPKPHRMSATTTQRGKSPETITERGVFLSRKVDGIDERGFCIFADYGMQNGEPKLMSLEINWRNLVPYKSYSVATTNDIIDFIKSGQATLPSQPEELYDLSKVKKLTITQFNPIYYSELGMYKMDFEYPYSEITVVADFGSTNTTTFYLNCPILSTNSISQMK
jgi:hypothetical protein